MRENNCQTEEILPETRVNTEMEVEVVQAAVDIKLLVNFGQHVTESMLNLDE